MLIGTSRHLISSHNSLAGHRYLVGGLADEEAEGEEGLKLPTEEREGGESAEGDEDGQQGEPSHDPAEAVSCSVPDVRQRDCHQSARRAVSCLWPNPKAHSLP